MKSNDDGIANDEDPSPYEADEGYPEVWTFCRTGRVGTRVA